MLLIFKKAGFFRFLLKYKYKLICILNKMGMFKLIVGTVLNKINKLTGRGSRFTIETDFAAAGVCGTYFEVSYKIRAKP